MKNQKSILMAAAFFGATAVILGALSAHALQEKADSGILTQHMVDSFRTGSQYQMYHALALFGLSFLAGDEKIKWTGVIAILFSFGILLFSGSIYLLTTYPLIGMEKPSYLGPVTPIGGLLFISGWIVLFISALKRRS